MRALHRLGGISIAAPTLLKCEISEAARSWEKPWVKVTSERLQGDQDSRPLSPEPDPHLVTLPAVNLALLASSSSKSISRKSGNLVLVEVTGRG